MKSKIAFLFAAFMVTIPLWGETVDPNLTSAGGYGYLIKSNADVDLWWAEGAYKVMKDKPVPSTENSTISMYSAKNEWESFVLCFSSKQDLHNVSVSLLGAEGFRAEIRKVEYVTVTHPTDGYAKAGEWPDPLPLFNGRCDIPAGDVQPFWVSIKTAKYTPSGDYSFSLSITYDNFACTVPVKLHVWDFTLPDTPTMRSLFGFGIADLAKYDHLNTDEEQQIVFEKHMKALSDFKMSPYNPFVFSNFKETVYGVEWKGGSFDSKNAHTGTYSYRISDRSRTSLTEGLTRNLLTVPGPGQYTLKGWMKSEAESQTTVLGVECFDKDKEPLYFENRYQTKNANMEWKEFSVNLGYLGEQVGYIQIHLCPCHKTSAGEDIGTVWFDDLTITGPDGSDILKYGDFEPKLEDIDIKLDFTEMASAAKRYFDEYGFSAFRLNLKGLGGGNYYARRSGNFEGFDEGTPEYEKLFERYLTNLERGLDSLGIVDKACIYWFDEPGKNDYGFIHETNARIKKYAPKLKPFLTENLTGFDISDVTDISCTIWHLINQDKIKSMEERGQEYWSYLCCGPKSPYITEFIDHDAVNMRAWLWGSYKYHLRGVLIWATTYWNSPSASPVGYLQNPWQDPMSWVTGDGTPQGTQNMWGNGDGRFFYPMNRDPNGPDKSTLIGEPIPSIRLEFLRDGIEDYEYLVMLESLVAKHKAKAASNGSKKLLEVPESILTDIKTFNKDPRAILQQREKLAKAIEKLNH